MGFIAFAALVDAADRTVARQPPPGRDLAEQVLRRVSDLGYQVVEQVGQHDSYGWCFTVRTADPRPIWCMLQLSDEWLLITHMHVPILQRLFGSSAMSAEHAKFDAALVSVLPSVEDVSNVRWFQTEDDLRHERAGQPGR